MAQKARRAGRQSETLEIRRNGLFARLRAMAETEAGDGSSTDSKLLTPILPSAVSGAATTPRGVRSDVGAAGLPRAAGRSAMAFADVLRCSSDLPPAVSTTRRIHTGDEIHVREFPPLIGSQQQIDFRLPTVEDGASEDLPNARPPGRAHTIATPPVLRPGSTLPGVQPADPTAPADSPTRSFALI